MFDISISVKGTATAVYLWKMYPTLKVRRTTPDFLARKRPDCNIRYSVDGTINMDDFRLLPDDMEMLSASVTSISIAPSHK